MCKQLFNRPGVPFPLQDGECPFMNLQFARLLQRRIIDCYIHLSVFSNIQFVLSLSLFYLNVYFTYS